MDKRDGEVPRFFSKTSCPTVPKNAVWELFILSTISGIENFLDKGEGEVSRFPSKILCLTLPKNFAGEHLCAVFWKVSVSE